MVHRLLRALEGLIDEVLSIADLGDKVTSEPNTGSLEHVLDTVHKGCAVIVSRSVRLQRRLGQVRPHVGHLVDRRAQSSECMKPCLVGVVTDDADVEHLKVSTLCVPTQARGTVQRLALFAECRGLRLPKPGRQHLLFVVDNHVRRSWLRL